jgi:hypothetical protein
LAPLLETVVALEDAHAPERWVAQFDLTSPISWLQ